MRATGERHTLHNQHQLNAFVENIQGKWMAGEKPVVQFMARDRSDSQNAMFYALYGRIADQGGDTVANVRRHCKLHYGVAILKAADPEWAAEYDRHIKPMSYEQKLFLMGHYPITSEFTISQGSDYIDSIIEDYTKQGYRLADPRQGSQGL